MADRGRLGPKARLGHVIGHIEASRHQEIKRALGYALDWPERKIL